MKVTIRDESCTGALQGWVIPLEGWRQKSGLHPRHVLAFRAGVGDHHNLRGVLAFRAGVGDRHNPRGVLVFREEFEPCTLA